ncbi:ATP-dependent helicase/DEAD/H associated domain-containing protein [Salinarchaeum sp. Harcht-Bsk1]|uniref:DEAD/DEAH box helicase n=1 Tax=Salinarchaeum sp. Harcht-Bsk1 TaxID=1333523 RepID=UPI00034244CD|nr:DEAD/DEAH box helicase [Salinarchaeum sp. Harcht-Bsk1]AGN00123.1 ATP-dependent helicase/DEAD/H associated domain-containing protein [Salinarchaeum sp. Harcht-Bsk1]
MSRESGADAFSQLGPAVRSALSARGFATPTEPQRLAIPPLADGRHTLVVAPTGTGKTETAMLPVFDAVAEAEHSFGISALYVTPLRALNRDMRDRLDWWGEELDLDIDVRHGDTSDYQRSKQADDPPDVLVTTPETLQAMFTGKKLRRALEDVEHVVIDEIHELAASKRGAQLAIALERLRDLAGPFQRVGLSATVGDPETVGAFLTGGRGCAIREVDVGSRLELDVVVPEVTAEDEALASELMIEEEFASHVRAIRDVVAENESTLIFVNTRQTAEAMGSRFTQLAADEDSGSGGEGVVDVGVHHGSLAKSARIEIEDSFKAGELDGLLCTSSMELGIDVGHVDHVVQYQSPRQVTRLLQRVGRAGHRSDKVSAGTVVATRSDDALEAMAIARRSLDGEVEPAPIHEGSLDVVANQVGGLVEGQGGVHARRAYEIVTAAYPFRDLDKSTFKDVVRELSKNRIVYLDEDADRIESSGTWRYVYENLSMIPDEETYAVEDVASGSQIGTLDERFVATFAEPGAAFIQGGQMWRVTNVDDDDGSLTVSPIEDPSGEIPSWIGEEIPVPRPVAEEVGELRGVAGRQFEHGADRAAVARDLARRYPIEAEHVARALDPIERHAGEAPLPTDEGILIEREGGKIVLNAPYGHDANETLGRMLSALLGQRTGSSVGLDVDPYRIDLEVPGIVDGRDVIAVLEETDPDHVEPLLELSLDRSEALAFRLSQVAEHFGAIKPWQGDSSPPASRLRQYLANTPAYEEAKREVFHEDLDVEAAADLLRSIQRDEIAIELVGGRTPIGTAGRSSNMELLVPQNADAGVVEQVKDRIYGDDVRLFCVHCTEYDRVKPVKRVREEPSCPHCESTMIAALHPWADDAVTAIKADDKDDEQEKLTERAYRSASLVQHHGKPAVIAMAARGVGPDTAARIINKHREAEADFYRDILEQERQYARTKSFWD